MTYLGMNFTHVMYSGGKSSSSRGSLYDSATASSYVGGAKRRNFQRETFIPLHQIKIL